jgi:hypothetical protein
MASLRRTMGLLVAAVVAVCPFVAGAAHAQELPPVTSRMLNKSAVVCMMIADSGELGGAYLLSTTGDEATDRDILAWTKQLHWDPAKPGETMRNVWFATGVAFGEAKAPAASTTCSPPKSRATTTRPSAELKKND